MKKINENIFVKILLSLITIGIMGVIVYHVYCYYDGLDPSDDTSVSGSNDNFNNQTLEFVDYNRKKERIFLGDKSYFLNVDLSDGGKVLVLDDLTISFVNDDLDIKYSIIDKLLLVVIYDGDSIYSVNIINQDKESINYNTIENRNYNYFITSPIINEKYKGPVSINNNKIYVTYVMNNDSKNFLLNNGKKISDIKKSNYLVNGLSNNTLLEYVIEVSNNNGKLVENRVFEYKLEDYIK